MKKDEIIKIAISSIISCVLATVTIMVHFDNKFETERKITNLSISKIYDKTDTNFRDLDRNKLEKEVFNDFKQLYIKDNADSRILGNSMLNEIKILSVEVGKLNERTK